MEVSLGERCCGGCSSGSEYEGDSAEGGDVAGARQVRGSVSGGKSEAEEVCLTYLGLGLKS